MRSRAFTVRSVCSRQRLGVDLAHAVAGKLDQIGIRDQDRFTARGHDPSSATVLTRLSEAYGLHTTLETSARLWGAPDGPDGDLDARARLIARDLVVFTRAAGPERIEGYVIGAPEICPQPASWLRELLGAAGAQQSPIASAEDNAVEEHELSFMGSPLVVDWPPAQGASSEAGEWLAVLRSVPRRAA